MPRTRHSVGLSRSLLFLSLVGITLSLTPCPNLKAFPARADQEHPAGAGQSNVETARAARARLEETYDRLPLSFEANEGQAERHFKFLSRGDGYTLSLSETGAVLG